MNKKFSTLVASLLFASAFSTYAGTAASMPAVPTAIETRATANVLDINTTAPTAASAVQDLLLSEFKDNSRLLVFSNTAKNTWTQASASSFLMFDGAGIHLADYMGGSVTSVPSNAFYFNYTNKQLETKAGLVLNLAGYSKFDIVPVTFNGKSSNFFVLRAWYDATTPVYINMTGSLSAGTNITVVNDVTTAALFASAETAFATIAADGGVLNKELKNGFELTISSAKGGVTVTGAEAFAGKLTAMKYDAGAMHVMNEGDLYPYVLKNKDGKYIYWDAETNKDSDKPGSFKLTSEADVIKAFESGEVANYDPYRFTIYAADNGSKAVQVNVDATASKRLYINNTNNEGRLTAFDATGTVSSAANWAVTSLGSSNKVDLTQFLTGQFVKVNYVANGEEGASNTYKIDGVLTIAEDGIEEDFAKAKSFVAEDPATHWAVTTADRGKTIKLTNRENPSIEVTLGELRGTNKTGVYEVAKVTAANLAVDELITITPVATVTPTDGYMVENENVLRNTSYYLAQSRQNADQDIPAYWAENHSMSHQIGATVNKDAATKWNLAFKVKGGDKAWKNETDSVLIVSTLHKWNATAKDVEEIKSTLAILPYTFQNRENNEFVKNYKYTNLEYYICDKDNNEAADNGAAQKFALKKKPGNTYNYVTLGGTNTYVTDNGYVNVSTGKSVFTLAGDKLFLGNSLENGSWEEMDLYAKDNNSLMLVQPSDDPEYHLVNDDVLAWGDTIKLYRDENANQALYEKRDNKSVVENDTLSFLNIDNIYDPQFKLNPAIFVDTAYVNRENNTCWQYLLAVNVDNSVKTYCPDDPKHNDPEWIKEHGVCPHAEKTPIVKGRFLVNLIDTANIYGATHLHTNPYVNNNEAGEKRAKLSFVPGMHIKDTLFLFTNDDTVKVELGTPDFNVAKFAFRYENAAEGTFKIQNMWKAYDPAQAVKDDSKVSSNNEGYLKWINGTVVVENGYNKGDLFRIGEGYEGTPTANEETPEVSTISVIATDGGVIISGAQGKKVTISNVLGQTVANTVIASDKAEIAAPAGVVVVAVEGEAAVKAIVK
ncbi:DUF6383 domain-containing protein [Parabacteroides sp. GYB001]|uniref:DUF6383 domain-containing protein n=1 Tax=Parabacteroides leei TaxID=2939491 RepID=UPI002017F3AD|nr:DUF6383 domain-containing protein [Parabacteroides leei]MCL3852416.1 DUF6383 domain-containing protein [Parabacteroides leei]